VDDLKSSLRAVPSPTSLRARKKPLMQAAIEETVLHLVLQNGYEQTSIQDIADAAVMSSRTFSVMLPLTRPCSLRQRKGS
jgi:transcriptional regulator GlxA family with amidase domain